FVALCDVGAKLLIHSRYHYGFAREIPSDDLCNKSAKQQRLLQQNRQIAKKGRISAAGFSANSATLSRLIARPTIPCRVMLKAAPQT
ncbi:hypothetical protein, partial [Salipiger aestuarii]|uniref:hypothetical protein n=1 Tax=Salipiger aestuarii TaxID=568098 RepID=UPI001CC3245F